MTEEHTGGTQPGPRGEANSVYDGKGIQGRSIDEDPTVWMEDGNVIVAAGVEPITLFRCHRAILTQSSDILSGLFTLPSLSAAETYNGLPVVPLFDPRGDVCQLLRVLYTPALSFGLRAVGTAEYIGGALRLAKKYMMEELYTRLVTILERDWPTSYEDWVQIQELVNRRMEQATENILQETHREVLPYRQCWPNPATVVRLARELDLRAVLPMALYELHRWYPPEPLSPGMPVFDRITIQEFEGILSMEDLRACLLSQIALRKIARCMFSALLEHADSPWNDMPPEVDHETCAMSVRAWILEGLAEAYGSRSVDDNLMRNPIWHRKVMEESIMAYPVQAALTKACVDCKSSFADCIRIQREALWDALPRIAGWHGEPLPL